MNVKDLHIKVQVTGEQNVLLQQVLNAKGVAWDTGDPCDGIINNDSAYLRLFDGKLFRILSDSALHFVQEVKGELLHWHTAMELIKNTEPLGPPKDLEKMSALVNRSIRNGFRFLYWTFGEYIIMGLPGRTPTLLRIYETGVIERTDPITGRFIKV